MAVSPEAMLISCVLRNAGNYELALKEGVNPTMFHSHREEWEWLERFWNRHRRQPTKAAFRDAFRDFRIFQVDDTGHFIEKVRQSHARHSLMGVMSECADLISSGDIDRAVSYMALQANTITCELGVAPDLNVIDDWEKVYEDTEYRRERYEEFGMAGIPTGFHKLDERTGGVQPGQSWIVAARLGEKKSWTLMRMAIAALLGGYNVHFTALEQSSIEVSMRAYNFLSGAVGRQVFQSQALMMGTEPDMKAWKQFLRQLRSQIKTNFTISDKRGIGAPEFRAQLERHKPDAWYLDYLTLAKTAGDGGWQDIGRLSKDIGNLAAEYGCATVSAAQLNRNAAQGKGPAGAEDLAQSDQIGQDAGAVITSRQLSPSINVFKLAKYRFGPGGFKWYAHLDTTRGIFEEIDKDRAMDLRDQDLRDAGDEDDD